MTTPSDAISTLALLLERDAPERALARGWVDGVEPSGTVRVHAGDPGAPGAGTIVECDRLAVTEGAELQLTRGDVVLYWGSGSPDDRGVILGRVGRSHAAPHAAPHVAPDAASADDGQTDDIPDELVIEAKQQLTLRVGDGSITLRADGRIQIRGKDLVSHAQRLNRIKGGAVSIN